MIDPTTASGRRMVAPHARYTAKVVYVDFEPMLEVPGGTHAWRVSLPRVNARHFKPGSQSSELSQMKPSRPLK
jgi:hypothetical protein